MLVCARSIIIQMLVVAFAQGAASSSEKVLIVRACMNTQPCASINNAAVLQELVHAFTGDPYATGTSHALLERIRAAAKPIEDDPVLVPVFVSNFAGKCLQPDAFHWERNWRSYPELTILKDEGLCIPRHLPFSWLLQAQHHYKGEGLVQEIDIPLARHSVQLRLKTEEHRNSGLPFIAHAAYAAAHYLAVYHKAPGHEPFSDIINGTGKTLLFAEQDARARSLMRPRIPELRAALSTALKQRAELIIKNYYGIGLTLPEWRASDIEPATNIALLKQFCLKD